MESHPPPPRAPGLSARAMLFALRTLPLRGKDALSWADHRRALEALALPAPGGVRVIANRGGRVPGEWIEPRGADPGRVLLYLHGGGYCIGSCRSYRHFTGNLARAVNARVFVPEYRLAPEHPFPAALEDALAAFHDLLAAGIAPARITAMGDSAGGGLALALALTLRDAGEPLPGAIVAFSPWTDLSLSGESITTRAAADPMLSYTSEHAYATAYLGGVSPREPRASPLFARLEGLPRVALHVGSEEILLDDSTRLAARAREAGVAVSLTVWPGMWHNWQSWPFILPEARHAIAAAAGDAAR